MSERFWDWHWAYENGMGGSVSGDFTAFRIIARFWTYDITFAPGFEFCPEVMACTPWCHNVPLSMRA